MDTVTMKLYEGLFLVDSAEAAADWKGTIAIIERVLERAGAEVVTLKKWDERKLAFEVRGMSRGTFILSYFRCDPLKITSIERDVQLSEQITRVLILTTDKMSEEDIARDTPAAIAAQETAAAEERKAAAEAEAVAKAEEAAAQAKAAVKEASEAETVPEAAEEETAEEAPEPVTEEAPSEDEESKE